jgi:hypothetical protein
MKTLFYVTLVSSCFQPDDQLLPFIVSKKQNHLKNLKKEDTFSDWIQPMYGNILFILGCCKNCYLQTL